jgi:hypothetical protein
MPNNRKGHKVTRKDMGSWVISGMYREKLCRMGKMVWLCGLLGYR